MTTYSRVSTHGVRWYAAVTLGVGLFLAAQAAEAVTFSITEAVRTIGGGYGHDGNEDAGVLLKVGFTDSFVLQNFSLDSVDQWVSFALGKVNLAEPNSGGINSNETDDLGVSWAIEFGGPLSVTKQLNAVVSASTGEVSSDDAIDYALHWDPVDVSFDGDGMFRISLNDLAFRRNGDLIQTATITLLNLPTVSNGLAPPPVGSVPEPGTIALFTLGLAGIGAARRKKPAG